jgi:hypothetical protein
LPRIEFCLLLVHPSKLLGMSVTLAAVGLVFVLAERNFALRTADLAASSSAFGKRGGYHLAR